MPAPFVPVPVPFLSGVRQDLGSIAQTNPAELRTATNVVFTRKGSIQGRPGAVSRDAQVQVAGGGSALSANLAAVVTGMVPAGIVEAGHAAGAALASSPLACWQGLALSNKGSQYPWLAVGTMWSLRQTKSATLKTYDPVGASRTNPVPVGQNVVGLVTSVGSLSGFPVLNAVGEVAELSTGSLANFTSDANVSAAGDALFFIDTAGASLIGQIPAPTLPAVTQVIVGGTADIGVTAQQNTSATKDSGGAYYVAYKSSVAAQVFLVRISSAGTVTQTLTLNGMGAVKGVGLTYDPVTNRLGLAWHDNLVPAIKTKVFTITAGVMADAAIDLTLTGAPLFLLGLDVGTFHTGTTHNGLMSVVFTHNNGNLYIGGRSFAAATETAITTLSANGLGGEKEWDPLFGGVAVAGRTLVGVLNSVDVYNQSSQWIVLDCTKLYASGDTVDRTVAAAGAYLGTARIMPSSVFSTSTSVSFAVPEGIQFSSSVRIVPLIQRAVIRRITLSVQPTQAVHAQGTTLLSGQYLHVFDGNRVRPDHFVEEAPIIYNTSAAAAGGSLPAGSFSYQTTWEAFNSRGQVIRSGASNLKTFAVALNNKVTIVSSAPQIWNNGSQLDNLRTRLWATKVNPTGASALYFAGEAVRSNPSFGVPITFVHTTEPVGNEEQLYETSQTLADMRAPGADRGVAYVNERVWLADQTTLYVSKLLKDNVAVSWNTEGTNNLNLPTTLGTVQGLGSMNQRLVVVCSRGVAVVSGPGVDDTGAGAGWSLEVIDKAPGAGESGPRAVVSTPAGVAYTGVDGDLWLIATNYQAVAVSRQVRDLAEAGALLDVTYVGSRLGTNPLICVQGSGSSARVLDTETGLWGNWTFQTPTVCYMTGVNGALWLQLATAPFIASVDGSQGDDLGSTVSATLVTGVMRPADPLSHGWGRIRSLKLDGPGLGASLTVSIQLLADDNQHHIMDKTQVYLPRDVGFGDPLWPDNTPEFRTTSQRCSYAFAIINITPAIMDHRGLTLMVSSGHEMHPTNVRT